MTKHNPYLFNIGDRVVYSHRTTSSPCVVIARKRQRDHFLSQAWGAPVFFNVYITEQVFHPLRGKYERVWRWEDREIALRSADILRPDGATDYASDEHEADWLNSDGVVLKSIKSGRIGEAHEIVTQSLLINP